MKINLAIAEDNDFLAKSLTEKLKLFSNRFALMYRARDGAEMVEYVNNNPEVQVILMDIEMPGVDGIKATETIRALYPEIHFIVLTVFDDDDKIFEAIKAGAHGYLLKDESAITLHNAITNVLENGGAPMSPAIARKAFEMLGRSQAPAEVKTRHNHMLDTMLTDREKEILQQTINGLDAKRIAAQLNISVLTIRKHIANIYQKLHVNSKAQIISLAHKKNWV